jgi:hypothetical protein
MLPRYCLSIIDVADWFRDSSRWILSIGHLLRVGFPFHFSAIFLASFFCYVCSFVVQTYSHSDGATFAVMASIIGGCPLALEYTINVPNLPSKKKAIFVWNWYNQVSSFLTFDASIVLTIIDLQLGNRENYQDCALVDVVGTATSFTAPSLFRANSLGVSSVSSVHSSTLAHAILSFHRVLVSFQKDPTWYSQILDLKFNTVALVTLNHLLLLFRAVPLIVQSLYSEMELPLLPLPVRSHPLPPRFQ